MDTSNIWKVLNSYFRDNPQNLVNHHIESYNDFYKKHIFQIFRDKNPRDFLCHVARLERRDDVFHGLLDVFSPRQDASHFAAITALEQLVELLLCIFNFIIRIKPYACVDNYFIRRVIDAILHVVEEFIDDYRSCRGHNDLFPLFVGEPRRANRRARENNQVRVEV